MSVRRQFSVVQLYEDHREKLKLSWLVSVGVDRQIELKGQGNYGADVVGQRVLTDQTIVIEGDRIVSVSPTAA